MISRTLSILMSISFCTMAYAQDTESVFAENKSARHLAIGFSKIALGATGLSAYSFLHEACETQRSIVRFFVPTSINYDTLILKNSLKSACLLGSSSFTLYSGFKDIFNTINDKYSKTKFCVALAAGSLTCAIGYGLNRVQ